MQKWYLLAIVAVLTLGVGAIYFLDTEQPNSVNVELANKIIGLVTTTLTTLLVLLGNASKVKEEAKEVKKEVEHNTAVTEQVVQIVENKADELARTASALASEKK